MSANRTRIVELRRGVERGEADNRRTGVMVADALPTLPFARLFPIAWEELRRLLCSFSMPGIVVVAVDAVKRQVAGTLCLSAKVDAANAAIVGRHGHCDLYLEGDPALSLRHMALVVSPLQSGSRGPQVSFRVLDLRTRSAFLDEHGRRLESVIAEGPTFLAAGSHALFIVVSGEDPNASSAWPESAADAWKCIPERVYLDERDAEPDRWRRRRKLPPKYSQAPEEPTDGGGANFAEGTGVVDTPVEKEPPPKAKNVRDQRDPEAAEPVKRAAGGDPNRITLVRTQPGPARARVSLLGDDDLELGQLTVTSDGRSQKIAIGEHAAAGGILLGRYERCDTHGASVVAHHGISRVHVLMLSIGEHLYAIDTGSTNGTFRPGSDAEVRIVRLEDTTELVLGEDLARVSWKPKRPA